MDLIKYLPSFYANSVEVTDIQTNIDVERGALQTVVTELLEQVFIDTSTWGLAYYEDLLNLHTDNTESYANRRARIKTYLRSQGTATKDAIKNICKSFVNGEVDVIESNSEYKVTIKFIGDQGIPSNLDYLRSSLREAIPAHLNMQFTFTYLLLVEVESMTLNELEQTTVSSFAM